MAQKKRTPSARALFRVFVPEHHAHLASPAHCHATPLCSIRESRAPYQATAAACWTRPREKQQSQDSDRSSTLGPLLPRRPGSVCSLRGSKPRRIRACCVEVLRSQYPHRSAQRLVAIPRHGLFKTYKTRNALFLLMLFSMTVNHSICGVS